MTKFTLSWPEIRQRWWAKQVKELAGHNLAETEDNLEDLWRSFCVGLILCLVVAATGFFFMGVWQVSVVEDYLLGIWLLTGLYPLTALAVCGFVILSGGEQNSVALVFGPIVIFPLITGVISRGAEILPLALPIALAQLVIFLIFGLWIPQFIKHKNLEWMNEAIANHFYETN